MKHYELVVFDWDGTLMDSFPRIVLCHRQVARDFGLAVPGEEAVRRLIGLDLGVIFRTLYAGHDALDVEAMRAAYRRHWLREDRSAMPLFDGVEDGLRRLEESGLMLAVATGKSRRGLARSLEQTGLGGLFVTSRCADEARAKPHPQMLLDILDFTGLESRQVLMVGDTTYDMEMAAGAGVDALGVAYGSHGVDELAACTPLPVARRFAEVTDFLL